MAADPIRSPTPARAQATVEEQSIRADTNALRQEALGADAQLEWSLSRASWQRLGYSVLLARAQARCGDRATAEHTLDVLDSPDDARRWALGE
jgi:hypothetical protein